MQFIGGSLQQQYVEKMRALDPSRCLAAGIDVGKYEALCLIADHRGDLVGQPLTFPLTEIGALALERQLTAAGRERAALSLRVGVETAGHYHRTIVSRLVAAGHDVVEPNPAHVKAVRAQQGSWRLKTDLRDAAAIVDLVISGGGRAPQQRDAALVEQLVWAALRRRRILARTALTNQLLGTLDLVFPGLDGCFADLLGTRVGPVLLHELADPDRLHRLGVAGLQAFVARRGVRLTAAKAAVLHQAAADASRLPAAERACRAAVLKADLSVLDVLTAQILQAEQRLAEVLTATPAAVLTSLPGVGVVRASNCGAALGDPARFGNADQAYRASGLVQASYESAGRVRRGQGISREGNAQLREAIIELGRGLAQRDPDFARYRASLAGRMKPLRGARPRSRSGTARTGSPSRSCAAASPTTPAGSPSRSPPRRSKEEQEAGRPVNKRPRGGLPARRDPPAGPDAPASSSATQDPDQDLTRPVAGTRTDVETAMQHDRHRHLAGPDCATSRTPGPSH